MAEEKGEQAAGEQQGRKPWTLREFGGKPVWDWLHLLSALAIPVVLAIVGFWFTAQQNARQQQIENQRARAERELAEQRAQDEALQAYLDQMSALLLDKDLRDAESTGVRMLARARTLTVLERLDPSRKTSIMRFLIEADLVSKSDGEEPAVALNNADLSGAHLNYFYLKETVLYEANLNDAHLFEARLGGADLRYAQLIDAHLNEAELRGAQLNNADLTDAHLVGASMYGVDLTDADLSNANLSGARGITDEELDKEADYLEGATMPNGQKYEDWLKDKESRGRNGEHNGAS